MKTYTDADKHISSKSRGSNDNDKLTTENFRKMHKVFHQLKALFEMLLKRQALYVVLGLLELFLFLLLLLLLLIFLRRKVISIETNVEAMKPSNPPNCSFPCDSELDKNSKQHNSLNCLGQNAY